MGNLVQCCLTLSNYFKCKDAPAQGEAERSPLLSSDGSDCDSPTLPDDLEDHMSTFPAGVTNPALEPEHFLFPDIILSSNLGGDVALVEPMVCLLVSEEEVGGGEGVRMEEPGAEERSNTGRSCRYSEVETQTEPGTAQAEVQTQTEVIVCNNVAVEREENTLMNAGAAREMIVDVWEDQVDIQTATQTSCEIHSDDQSIAKTPPKTQKQRKDSQTWPDVDAFAEPEVLGEKADRHKSTFRDVELVKHAFQTDLNTGVAVDGNTDEEQKTMQPKLFKLQQNSAAKENADSDHHTLQTQEKKTESVHILVTLSEHNLDNMDENVAAGESQNDVHLTKCSNTDITADFHSAVDSTQPSLQTDEQVGPATEVSHQSDNEKVDIPMKTKQTLKDQSVNSADQIESQEDFHLAKSEEDNNRPDLQGEVKTQLSQDEEEAAEIKKRTLFLVDKLFLAAPHVKGL